MHGHRAILDDLRRAATKENLNLQIEWRESFRRFALSIPERRTGEWFKLAHRGRDRRVERRVVVRMTSES
ncbi:MAG: hypothetical protein K8F56_16855 [Rhodocyclaceae bacterium]|nr:hypothetical protein [Rhodocyclaceae bacterium]